MKTMAVVLSMFLGTLFYAAGGNVEVANAGFEKGGQLPDAWTTVQSEGNCAVLAWDKTTTRTGERSLYIRNPGPRAAGWRTDCPVKGDTTYTFTAWAKVRDGKGQTCLRVRGSGTVAGQRKKWEAASKGISGTPAGWTQLSLEFKTPPDTKGVQLWLWNVNGAGDEVWFDDVALEAKQQTEK